MAYPENAPHTRLVTYNLGGKQYELIGVDVVEGGTSITRYAHNSDLYNMAINEGIILKEKGVILCIHGGHYKPLKIYGLSS